MSFANVINKSDIDGNVCSMSDNENVNQTASGSIKASEKLHDPAIEETNKTACKTDVLNDGVLERETENVIETESIERNDKMTVYTYYGWQAFCLLIILFSVYETYQNVLPRDIRYPAPQRFFHSKSPVADYPNGNLMSLQKKVSLSDLAFVMFYAPWSAESQHARPVYETVAKMFQHEAEFSAITCWQPNGECRQQYKKVMSWPVLMAYNRDNVAISYNGQWSETALGAVHI